MKFSLRLVTLVLAAMVWTACGSDNVQQKNQTDTNKGGESKQAASETIPADFLLRTVNAYQVVIPKYLSDVQDLNAVASLQCKNADKEFYLIVIDEPKNKEKVDKKSLTAYYDVMMKGLVGENIVNATQPVTQKSNNVEKMQWEAVAQIENVRVQYYMAAFESETHFYQLVIWMYEDDKDTFAKDVQTIIQSFKEKDTKKNLVK